MALLGNISKQLCTICHYKKNVWGWTDYGVYRMAVLIIYALLH
ncbi:hypothetical protein ABID99_004119 [Mucilaginibacter sp. OAE612]